MPENYLYKVGSSVYDIPEDKREKFLSKYPDAQQVESFIVDKDTFDIPVDKVDSFLEKYPNAENIKKKSQQMQEVSSTPSRESMIQSQPSSIRESQFQDNEKIDDNAVEGIYIQKGYTSPKMKFDGFESSLSKLKSEKEITRDDIKNIAYEWGLQYKDDQVSLLDTDIELYNDIYSDYIKRKSEKEKSKNPLPKDWFLGLASGANKAIGNTYATLGLLTPGRDLFDVTAENINKANRDVEDSMTRGNNGISESWQNGKYGQAIGEATVQLSEQIPNLIALATFSKAGIGNVGLGYMGVTTGVEKYESLDDSDMPEAAKIINAINTGLSEVVMEGAVTLPLLKSADGAIQRLGVDGGKQVIKESIEGAFEAKLRTIYKSISPAIQEGLSELATTESEKMTDYLTGESNEYNPFTNESIDSFITGALMGGGISVPNHIADIKDSQQRIQAEKDYIKSVLRDVPQSISIDDRIKAVELITERKTIEKEIDSVDEGFRKKGQERIKEINEELSNMEVLTNQEQLTIKKEKDEVQQQEQEQLQEGATDEKVGDIQIEQEKVASQPEEVSVEDVTKPSDQEAASAQEAPPISEEGMADGRAEETKPPVSQTIEQDKDKPESVSLLAQERVEYSIESPDVFKSEIKKAVKEASKSERGKATQIIENIRKYSNEALKGKIINERQRNAIVTKIRNAVKTGTQKQIDKALKYVDRVVVDANYANDVIKVRQDNKKIKKALRSGKYGTTYTPVVNDFLNIKPSELELDDFKRYQQIQSRLMKPKIPDIDGVVEFVSEHQPDSDIPKYISGAKTASDLNKAIMRIGETKIEDIDTYRQQAKIIREAARKLDELEVQGEITSEKAQEIRDTIEDLAMDDSQFGKEVKQLKSDIIDISKETNDNIDESDFTPEQNSKIKQFKDIPKDDLMGMDLGDVDLYNKISDGLEDGFINKELYDFVVKHRRQKNIKEFTEIAEQASDAITPLRKAADIVSLISKRLADYLDPLRSGDYLDLTRRFNLTMKTLWDNRFNLGKTKPIYNKIISPVAEKVTRALQDVDNSLRVFYRSSKKFDKDTKEHRKTRIKLGMILQQLEYQSNTTMYNGKELKWDELPVEARDVMRRIMQNVDWAGVRMDAKNKIEYQEVYAEMPKDGDGNIDIEKALDDLTLQERIFMEEASKVAQSLTDKVRVVTESRGLPYEEVNNYMPHYVIQETLGKDSGLADPSTTTQAFNDMIGMGKQGLGTKTGSIYKRVKEPYLIDLDIMNIIPRKTTEVNRDFHLTEVMRNTLGSLNSAALKAKGEQKTLLKALYGSMFDAVVSEYNYRISSAHGLLKPLIKWKRTLALARVTRPPQEYAANLIRYIVSEGLPNYKAGYNPIYREILDYTNAPIVNKVSRWHEELTDSNLSRSEETVMAIITAADTHIGKVAYATEFNKKFKELTGEKFSPDSFLNPEFREQYNTQIQESSRHAMGVISTLFNAQSGIEAPSKHKFVPFAKTEGQEKGSGVSQLYGYMQSFTFNETAQAIDAFRDMFLGTNQGRGKAFRKVLALSLSNYMYSNIGLMFYQISRAMADDDETIMEALREHFAPENQLKVMLGSMAALMTGRYGNVARPIISIGLGVYEDFIKKTDVSDEVKDNFESIKKSAEVALFARPMPARSGRASQYLETMIPVLGEVASDVLDAGVSVTDFIAKKDKVGWEKTLSPEEKEFWMILNLSNQILAFAYPNPYSPSIDRTTKQYMYQTTPGKENMPKDDELKSVLEGLDIDDLPGSYPSKIRLNSLGKEEFATNKEQRMWQDKSMEIFEDRFSRYIKANPDIKTTDNEKDINNHIRNIESMWNSSKTQAKNQVFEWSNVDYKKEKELLKKYNAMPTPHNNLQVSLGGGEKVWVSQYPDMLEKYNKLSFDNFIEIMDMRVGINEEDLMDFSQTMTMRDESVSSLEVEVKRQWDIASEKAQRDIIMEVRDKYSDK